MIFTTIVNGVYKPIYNWEGGHIAGIQGVRFVSVLCAFPSGWVLCFFPEMSITCKNHKKWKCWEYNVPMGSNMYWVLCCFALLRMVLLLLIIMLRYIPRINDNWSVSLSWTITWLWRNIINFQPQKGVIQTAVSEYWNQNISEQLTNWTAPTMWCSHVFPSKSIVKTNIYW